MLAGDGVTITAVRKDGGAGAAFAMGQRGTQPLPRKSGLFADVTGSRQMLLANAVDMVNVHFMAVLDPRNSPTTNAPILARLTSEADYLEFTRTHLILRNQSGGLGSVTYYAGTALGLYEVRWATDEPLAQYYNGALVGYSVSPITVASWPAQVFGGGRFGSESSGYTGPAGRCISVIVDPVHGPTDLEPAVRVARQTLAGQYGITLT